MGYGLERALPNHFIIKFKHFFRHLQPLLDTNNQPETTEFRLLTKKWAADYKWPEHYSGRQQRKKFLDFLSEARSDYLIQKGRPASEIEKVCRANVRQTEHYRLSEQTRLRDRNVRRGFRRMKLSDANFPKSFVWTPSLERQPRPEESQAVATGGLGVLVVVPFGRLNPLGREASGVSFPQV